MCARVGAVRVGVGVGGVGGGGGGARGKGGPLGEGGMGREAGSRAGAAQGLQLLVRLGTLAQVAVHELEEVVARGFGSGLRPPRKCYLESYTAPDSGSIDYARKPYRTRGGNKKPCVFPRSRLSFTLKAGSKVNAVQV